METTIEDVTPQTPTQRLECLRAAFAGHPHKPHLYLDDVIPLLAELCEVLLGREQPTASVSSWTGTTPAWPEYAGQMEYQPTYEISPSRDEPRVDLSQNYAPVAEPQPCEAEGQLIPTPQPYVPPVTPPEEKPHGEETVQDAATHAVTSPTPAANPQRDPGTPISESD